MRSISWNVQVHQDFLARLERQVRMTSIATCLVFVECLEAHT